MGKVRARRGTRSRSGFRVAKKGRLTMTASVPPASTVEGMDIDPSVHADHTSGIGLDDVRCNERAGTGG